jgi:hypothetical protein
MEEVVVLDLRDLEAGIPALTQALGQVQAEAAAVCLEYAQHRVPVRLHVRKINDIWDKHERILGGSW